MKILDELPKNRGCFRGIFEPESPSDFQPTEASTTLQTLREQEARPKVVLRDGPAGKDSEIHALVNRLERRNAELERTASQLLQANHQLEESVREHTLKLQAAQAEMEAFNSSVSHDLRGPITAILGFSYLFQHTRDEDLPSIGRRHASKIAKGAVRMELMLREFMKLADVNRGELRREPCGLAKIAAAVVEKLHASEPSRRIEFIVHSGLAAQADRRLVHIVLENLLGNAWKFTAKAGAPRIELGICPDQVPIAYFIRDNGAGFDMSQSQRLFQPFQRFHDKSEFPGIGIGLAVVQRAIARHGGKIWAESTPGKGASFFFTLT